MSSGNSIFSQVVACTYSETDYDTNSEHVIRQLSLEDSQYIKEFIRVVYEILNTHEYSPTQKFYSLSLLVKATKTKKHAVMDRLAKSSSLLNKLFHDAQYDRDKSVGEKGKTFFSKSPSEEQKVLGNSYLRMLLGAFNYWDNEFGTTDPKERYHCFHAINAALAKGEKMPEHFSSSSVTSLDKSSKKKSEFKLKPTKIESNEKDIIPKANKDEDNDYVLRQSDAYLDLMRCNPSKESYEENSKTIFDRVLLNSTSSSDYNKMLLKSIHAALSRTYSSPACKFYSMYLLVQLTETKNNAFMLELAKETKLMNQIYTLGKKACNDQKSTTSLSQIAEESNNYSQELNVLVLEAIKYWNYTYGNSDPANSFYHFTHLHSNLKAKGKFPKQYKYIKAVRGDLVTSSKHGEPTGDTTVGVIEEVGDPIGRLVRAYIVDGTIFREDYTNISCILIKQPPVKSQLYLQETLRVLQSPRISAKEKFYALYLLAKTTETKNKKIVDALVEAKDLLDKLFRDAQVDSTMFADKRGKTFFSKHPSNEEAVIGNNYLELLLETLNYWSRTFGTDDRRSSNYVFRAIRDELARDTMFVKQDHYIERNLEEIDDRLMENFELIPFNEVSQRVHAAVMRANQSGIKSRGNRETFVNFSIDDFEKKLSRINYSKIVLTQFLTSNNRTNVDEQLLHSLVQDVLTNYNDIHPYLGYFVSSPDLEKERYKLIILQEGKLANGVEKEYMDCTVGKFGYRQLRNRLLAILAPENYQESERQEIRTTISRSLSPQDRSLRARSGTPDKESKIMASSRKSFSPERSQLYEKSIMINKSITNSSVRKSPSPLRNDSFVNKSLATIQEDQEPVEKDEKAMRELEVKLNKIKQENVYLNRENRVLCRENMNAIQEIVKKGDTESKEIENLKAFLDESRRKMEELENQVNKMREVKEKQQAESVPEEKIDPANVKSADDKKSGVSSPDNVVAPASKRGSSVSLSMPGKELEKLRATNPFETKTGDKELVKPVQPVQRNKHVVVSPVLDQFTIKYGGYGQAGTGYY